MARGRRALVCVLVQALLAMGQAGAAEDPAVLRSMAGAHLRSGDFKKAAGVLRKMLALPGLAQDGEEGRSVRKSLSDALAGARDFEASLWHFGKVTLNGPVVRMPPLSKDLLPIWRRPSAAEPAAAGAHLSYAEPGAIPAPALRSLRDYLSRDVLGRSYDAGFRSFSAPISLMPAPGEERDMIAQALRHAHALLPKEGRSGARCAEWWAHRRPTQPPAPGAKRLILHSHPLHFDNDGVEAQGTNPLYTSLLYLTNSSAKKPAPTVIVNTTKTETGFFLDGAAWTVHAAEGRIAQFAGHLLHGTLPSFGPTKVPSKAKAARDSPEAIPWAARLSLNIAWWPFECRRAEPRIPPPPPGPDPAWRSVLAAGGTADTPMLAPVPVLDAFCGDDGCGPRFRDEL